MTAAPPPSHAGPATSPDASRRIPAWHARFGQQQVRQVTAAMLATLFLIALTVVVFTMLPRFVAPGQPLVENLDFEHGFRGWSANGLVTLDETARGQATLRNLDPDEAVYLRRLIELPPGRTYLLVGAEIAAHEIEAGAEPWHRARIYLIRRTGDGTYLWDQPYDVVRLAGSAERHQVERVIPIAASVPEVMLGIELPYATGVLQVAGLRLEQVDERPSFRLAATLVVAGWCLLVAWTTIGAINSIRRPKVRLLLLLTLAVPLALILIPAGIRRVLVDGTLTGFGLDGLAPDTLGHLLILASLAFLMRCGRPGDPVLLHLAGWFLAGVSFELLQIFTADRQPDLAEWLADASGIVIGIVMAEIGIAVDRVLEMPSKKRKKKPLTDMI
jgi:hypothetical protein